jgi:pimeloyl-ACP methyl ester carboxylesterase
MIEDARGNVEYDECGVGPTVVLVPGSCSTGAAWRPVIAASTNQFRCVTTSLLGYGATAERRTSGDTSIAHEVEALGLVMRKTGARVHLVGHSFGGLVALATALHSQACLASLIVIEAPVAELLRESGEHQHYRAFRQMTDGYFADFSNGNAEAVAAMIDFYGGAGTFASWPPRVRAYAMETTAINILDWASAYTFSLTQVSLATIAVPALIVCGGASHPAVQRANALLSASLSRAVLATIDGAAHFMIATHADQVSQLIAQHVRSAGARPLLGQGRHDANMAEGSTLAPHSLSVPMR